MDVIKERIALARRHKAFTNCFGTALYIAGVIKRDEFTFSYAWMWEWESQLKGLTKLDKPELYSLAIFRKGNNRDKYLDHMAIVVKINPTLLTYRDVNSQPLIENVSLEEAVKEWGSDLEYRRIQSYTQ